MSKKLDKLLFVTSFVPVAAFKTIARLGDATWGQAKIAVLVGFILAAIQYVSARKVLHYNTYLEKAFLGFLLAGTIWVYTLPPNLAHFFVDHSVALLYFTLFLMTLLPQVFGYEPFTYAIAKQWYPESVWGTPDFRLINYRITYVWSAVFFAVVPVQLPGAWQAAILHSHSFRPVYRNRGGLFQKISGLLLTEEISRPPRSRSGRSGYGQRVDRRDARSL